MNHDQSGHATIILLLIPQYGMIPYLTLSDLEAIDFRPLIFYGYKVRPPPCPPPSHIDLNETLVGGAVLVAVLVRDVEHVARKYRLLK
jgi:hypothetical protein